MKFASKFFAFVLIFLALQTAVLAQPELSLKTEIPSGVNQIAPGGTLVLSIELTSFGAEKRADVTIIYEIQNSKAETVFETQETVVVETTSSLVRAIEIPPDFKTGKYYLVVELSYPNQEAPAITTIQFEVLPTLFGLFLRDTISIILIFSSAILIIIVFFLLYIRKRKRILTKFDYSNIPKEKRAYFEILSKVIAMMRLHVGDEAIKSANKIGKGTSMIFTLPLKKENNVH